MKNCCSKQFSAQAKTKNNAWFMLQRKLLVFSNILICWANEAFNQTFWNLIVCSTNSMLAQCIRWLTHSMSRNKHTQTFLGIFIWRYRKLPNTHDHQSSWFRLWQFYNHRAQHFTSDELMLRFNFNFKEQQAIGLDDHCLKKILIFKSWNRLIN